MKAATQNELEQFVAVVKERLAFRLEAVSLNLIDLGLKRGKAEVLTPGSEVLIVAGWVQRPATQEVKEFSIRVGADMGETGPEEVGPLCKAIVDSCLEAFYPKIAHA